MEYWKAHFPTTASSDGTYEIPIPDDSLKLYKRSNRCSNPLCRGDDHNISACPAVALKKLDTNRVIDLTLDAVSSSPELAVLPRPQPQSTSPLHVAEFEPPVQAFGSCIEAE